MAPSPAAPTAPMARYALLLHGRYGHSRHTATATIASNISADLTLIAFCAATHMEFVVNANAKVGGVDIFIHSWNPEFGPDAPHRTFLASQYGPHLRESLHQPVEHRENGRSQSLSLGRAAQLLLANAAGATATPAEPMLRGARSRSHRRDRPA